MLRKSCGREPRAGSGRHPAQNASSLWLTVKEKQTLGVTTCKGLSLTNNHGSWEVNPSPFEP